MTQHVRSLKNAAKHEPSWRELRSPPAANDVLSSLVPLSRALPKSRDEVAVLLSTLDPTQANDLRAAAMLVLLGLGLRKRELVQLDVSDVVLVGAVVCVSVKSRARRDKGRETFLPVTGGDARILRRYVESQHEEAAALTAPLFYSVEHGRIDRMRPVTPSGISYWLLELGLRARHQLNGDSRWSRRVP